MRCRKLFAVVFVACMFLAMPFWAGAAADAPRQVRDSGGRPGNGFEESSPDLAKSDDPFAGLMDEQPIEVIKTGPSCQFIKIQLPPGVTFEDLQGLPTP